MNRPGKTMGNNNQTTSPTGSSAGAPRSPINNQPQSKDKSSTFRKVTTVLLLFSATLLTVALIGFIMNFRQNDESQYVATDKMQAVFLNGGQVYFGKIRELNNKYVGVTDIYYLRVNQQVQPKQGEQSAQDISLVKLGCELHGPQDQMIINREQVVFWENLKYDGKVAKAVESYKQANPDGKQNCEATSQQSTPTTKPQDNADNKQSSTQQNQAAPQTAQ